MQFNENFISLVLHFNVESNCSLFDRKKSFQNYYSNKKSIVKGFLAPQQIFSRVTSAKQTVKQTAVNE